MEQPYWQYGATLLASLGNPTGKIGQLYWQIRAILLARLVNPTGKFGQSYWQHWATLLAALGSQQCRTSRLPDMLVKQTASKDDVDMLNTSVIARLACKPAEELKQMSVNLTWSSH